MIVTWPSKELRSTSDAWSRSGRFTGGGQLLSGSIARGRTDGGGFWMNRQGGILLSEAREIQLWSALETIIGDGVTSFVVPRCASRFKPRVPGSTPGHGIPHSDGALFSDETGYSQGEVVASTNASAARRATTLQIHLEVAGDLIGGEFFSITHADAGKRLYTVGIVETAAEVSTVTIWPPLRSAVAADDAIDFDDPGCMMTLVDPANFAADLQSDWWAEKDVTFAEAEW